MEQKSQYDIVKEHIEWAFKGHDVGNFGHKIGGEQQYGISFKGLIFNDSFELLNQLGLEVSHVQHGYNSTLILVVYERRRN